MSEKTVNMSNKNDILKVQLSVMGLPVNSLFSLMVFSFILSYYFAFPGLVVYLCVSAVLSYAYKRYFLKEYVSLSYNAGYPMDHQLLIKGLPLNFLKEINSLIESNQLVEISLPQNIHLRKAISQYVYNRMGFVEFYTSDTIKVQGKNLNKRAFLLSYRNKSTLQNSISILMNRGWDISGELGMERSLLDRIYTQRMVYTPS